MKNPLLTFLLKQKKIIGDILIFILLVVFFNMDFMYFLEYRVQDAVYQSPSLINPEIIVIGIDEATIEQIGTPDQWSRNLMADAINILNSDEDFRPAVIALDILYTNERNIICDECCFDAGATADANLAEAARAGGNVVVASRPIIGLAPHPSDPSRVISSVVGIEKPFAALREHVSYGSVSAIFDRDSTIRRKELSFTFQGDTLYSFAYEIYKKYPWHNPDTLAALKELDEVYITYTGLPGDYKQFSFLDIFEEDFIDNYFYLLMDAIVLIGPFAPGMMDAYHTAIDRNQMNGVEIHANIVQMFMEGTIKRNVSPQVNFNVFLLMLVLAMIIAHSLDVKFSIIVFAVMGVAYFVTAMYVFNQGYIMSIVYPIAAPVVVYVYNLLYKYIMETIEKRRVKSAFKKYVDPKLVDKLMDSGEANSDEVGKQKDIAVLFVDVRGFTPMTEALKDQPELIVKILNEYLELTSSAVFNNGGSVDKFIGDATMALFNGFVPLDDYVYKAVRAAWDIVQGATEVNKSIKEKYGVDVGFGVGVNCGAAIVGNLGPSFRKDYTAIGDAVNTAARLESNALRSQVLISRYVYDIVKDRVITQSIGAIPLKGKSEELEVFSVEGLV
jgi:adenylate cyclase